MGAGENNNPKEKAMPDSIFNTAAFLLALVLAVLLALGAGYFFKPWIAVLIGFLGFGIGCKLFFGGNE